MPLEVTGPRHTWFATGQEFFPALLRAIDEARESVCLEVYIFAPGPLGERFRDALVKARQRGARVRVLVDALGSYSLPGAFWRPLREAGGDVRVFNPIALGRLGIRDHRKLLICDGRVAFIGGFNIAPEYDGDGVTRGWFDLALKVEGPLVERLAESFEEMFARASFLHKWFVRLRKSAARKTLLAPQQQLLLSGPGRERSPIKRALHLDLAQARSVRLIMGYFLPTWSLRRQLLQLARRGVPVQLILPGKSDVLVARLAGQSLYTRFLRAGAQIYEYQPQVLHAKLMIIDDVVYVGSANLDQRSLNINYELLVRSVDQEMAEQGRAIFANTLKQCRLLTLEQWRSGRSLWRRFKHRWAYFLLVHLDPYIARRQWRALPD